MKGRSPSPLQRRQFSRPLLEPVTAGVQGWLDGFVVYVSVTLVAHVGGFIVAGLVIGGTGFAAAETWTRPGFAVSTSDLVLAGLGWLLFALAGVLVVALRAAVGSAFRPSPGQIRRRMPYAALAVLLVNGPVVGLAGAATGLIRSGGSDPVIVAALAMILGIAWTTLTWFVLPATLLGQRSLGPSITEAFGLARRRWLSIVVSVVTVLCVQLVWTFSLWHFLASDLTTHPEARVWGILVLSLVQAAALGSLIVVSTVRLYMQRSMKADEMGAPSPQEQPSTKRNAAA